MNIGMQPNVSYQRFSVISFDTFDQLSKIGYLKSFGSIFQDYNHFGIGNDYLTLIENSKSKFYIKTLLILFLPHKLYLF